MDWKYFFEVGSKFVSEFFDGVGWFGNYFELEGSLVYGLGYNLGVELFVFVFVLK